MVGYTVEQVEMLETHDDILVDIDDMTELANDIIFLVNGLQSKYGNTQHSPHILRLKEDCESLAISINTVRATVTKFGSSVEDNS